MGGATLHKIMFPINKGVLDNFILLLDGINHYLDILYITQAHRETYRFKRQDGCLLLKIFM